jgi:PIN domain nuclease of toxin-antitoxin system
MAEQPLVLDTHVWIWIISGDQTIKTSIRQKIQLALEKSRVIVSAISVWEIGMLWKKGRIQLKEPLSNWVHTAIDRSGFFLAPLTDAIAVESIQLPGQFHNDPADRMIVATARLEKAVLLTRDSHITEYGNAGHVDFLSI